MKETKIILVLRGLYASGKTTFAREWINKDPEHRIRFNRDDIRNMMGDYWNRDRENFIDGFYYGFLNGAMSEGYDIVLDNMNLDDDIIEDIQDDINWFNDMTRNDKDVNWIYEMEIKDFFNVPLQICIDRDAQRDKPIGENIIRKTYDKYKDKIIPWKYLN